MLSGNNIRSKFVEYFTDKLNHKHIPSSSLIPDNPTVLLTPAGMLQFVPIFLGYENPPTPPRAVTYQKCARAGGKDSDIENVGRTPRHHTFFEMLGNFSFGDYFKKEIIPWSWEFVTDIINLPEEKLWVTIYLEDDEAFEIWKNDVKVPEDRILRCGKKDNFWGPPGPTGPCGPCTEIHYDLGEHLKCGDNCYPGSCECDRFVEIWNLVFMELFLDEEGKFSPLEKKNVDTGMGLERVTMAVQGKMSTFETDLLQPILDKVCLITGKEYNKDKKIDVSLRIITDHARCVTFLVADGLIPGNIGRNYVLRMILRRALRHGKILGVEGSFLNTIVDTVIDSYKCAYQDLKEKRTTIKDIIKTEEDRFEKTIDRGLSLLEKLIAKTQDEKKQEISGEDAFTLYDTYGFPLELTIEIAQEKNLTVNVKEFQDHMEEQKRKAKEAHVTESLTDNVVFVELYKQLGGNTFTGYNETTTKDCKIIGLVKDNKIIESAKSGDMVSVILDKTSFYAESGGQVGDSGKLVSAGLSLNVLNTLKFENLHIHKCELEEGDVKISSSVDAIVDAQRRKSIAIHHTATHLVHSALKKVLGDSVSQAGSMVSNDRARFDFSYGKALTFDQLKSIESYVNKWIQEDLKSEIKTMSPEEAKNSGATALFGEKYGDSVRVVNYGSASKELCGGTHLANTGQINLCKIISESALAAGIRRIELVCSNYAIDYVNEQEKELNKLCNMLKVPMNEISDRVQKLTDSQRATEKKLKALKSEIAMSKVNGFLDNAFQLEGYKVLVCRMDNVDSNSLKSASDRLLDKLGESIVVIGSVDEESDKVTIVVNVCKSYINDGLKAGDIANKVAQICGGRGGGKPNYAQAGAKNPSKLDEALEKVSDIIKETVSPKVT